MLAGVSIKYYTRMERGNLAGVSESVLDAVAQALRLDDAEHDHLFDLAWAVRPGGRTVPGPLAQRAALASWTLRGDSAARRSGPRASRRGRRRHRRG